MEARDIVRAPLITEKTMIGTAVQQYAFEVDPRATKTQIKHAVAEIFGVTVVKINTINVSGKRKSFAKRGRRSTGTQANWKKAIVTLAPGQKIALGGVNYFEQ